MLINDFSKVEKIRQIRKNRLKKLQAQYRKPVVLIVVDSKTKGFL
jgi:hypothetical protein